MAVPQQALSTAMATFQSGFVSIQRDFLGYGLTTFLLLLTIAFVIKFLEYAANKDVAENLPNFVRELLIAGFFYSVMLNLSWLSTLPASANQIGMGYLGTVDPSSIIVQGVNIANTIMKPLEDAGILATGATMFIGLICSVVIMFCLINIALNVAVTMVVTQALISMSPLFLAGGAFQASRQVARNVIDAIIANSVKLIGYYLVIYIGNKTLSVMVSQIDKSFNPLSASIDQYCYIVAVTALYYSLAKTLPDQLAKLVSGVVQENRGTEIGAAAIALQRAASMLAPAGAAAKAIAAPVATEAMKMAGATLSNVLANYSQMAASTGTSGIQAAGKAASSSFGNLVKSTGGAVADKYRDIASRLSGGAGNPNVKSVSERMHQSTQSTKAQTQASQTQAESKK